MTPEEIREAGLDALKQRLGRVGMVRFLQLFNSGSGDYTKERREWVDRTSLADLKKLVARQRTRTPGRKGK